MHLVHESLRRCRTAGSRRCSPTSAPRTWSFTTTCRPRSTRASIAESRLLLERTAALARFDAELAASARRAPDRAARARRAGAPRSPAHLRRSGAAAVLRVPRAGAPLPAPGDRDARRRRGLARARGRAGARARGARRARAGAPRHYLAARRGPTPRACCASWRRAAARRDARPRCSSTSPICRPSWREGDRAGGRAGRRPRRPRRLGRGRAALPRGARAARRINGDREIECRALLGLGKMLNLRGKHEQVLGMAERGLALSGDLALDVRARLLQMKAGAHFYLGQYRAAVPLLDQVRSLLPAAPPIPSSWSRPSTTWRWPPHQGRFREASQEFRAALAQVRGGASPRAPLYLSNLALLLCDLGELAEARRAAEEGLRSPSASRIAPRRPCATWRWPRRWRRAGDLDGALAALRRAEELNAELRMEVIAADLLALRGPHLLRPRPVPPRGRVPERGDRAAGRAARRSASQRVPGHARLVRAARRPPARGARPAEPARAARRHRARTTSSACASTTGWPRPCSRSASQRRRSVATRGARRWCASAATPTSSRCRRARSRRRCCTRCARGIELDVAAAALVEAGSAIEDPAARAAGSRQAGGGRGRALGARRESAARTRARDWRRCPPRGARSRPPSEPRFATSPSA